MRITRIDFEGRHEIDGQSGHWYATAQRRDGMHNGPDIVLVTIFAPQTPNGREHHVAADCEDDLRSIAERLQYHLDGCRGSNSMIHEYYVELLRLSGI